MFKVQSLFVLKREHIVTEARRQADAGEAMMHAFEPGSSHALTYERAYLERRRELDFQASEIV